MSAKINGKPVHITVHFDDAAYPVKVQATVDEIFTGDILMSSVWTVVGSDPHGAAMAAFDLAFQWLQAHMDELDGKP